MSKRPRERECSENAQNQESAQHPLHHADLHLLRPGSEKIVGWSLNRIPAPPGSESMRPGMTPARAEQLCASCVS